MANQDTLAYSQVKAILGLLSDDYISKIPKGLIEYIDSKSDDTLFEIDLEKGIENQELLDKTINIIAFINYKYWSDNNEKEELIKIYSENDNKKVSNFSANGSIKNDIFDNNYSEHIGSKELVSYDNKVLEFFKKIVKKIKSLLK